MVLPTGVFALRTSLSYILYHEVKTTALAFLRGKFSAFLRVEVTFANHLQRLEENFLIFK